MRRISFIAHLLNGYDTVVDIGTDHGLVLKEAFDQGFIKYAIASDINPLPLQRAKSNLEKYPADIILSDGFKQINYQADIAVICGLGARSIIDIIEHDHNQTPRYLLSAHDKPHVLRKYLSEHGFKIEDEYVVKDGFYYVLMLVVRGEDPLIKADWYLGPKLKHKPEATAYYQSQVQILKDIQSQVGSDSQRFLELQEIISYYQFK